MNKMRKRFIALLVVFTSIISFLPIQFGFSGQAANAIDANATDIEVEWYSVDNGDTVTFS